MIKMNPEAKVKVLAALRSGEYTQGTGALNENGCFCVWGLISDVSGLDEWLPSTQDRVLRYGENGDICFPSLKVRDWVGIDTSVSVGINGHFADLMQHNDTGATFAQLADAIEAQL